MKNNILITALLSLSLLGCKDNDNIDNEIEYKGFALNAIINQTKADFSENQILWEAGDEINVTVDDESYKFTTLENGAASIFTTTDIINANDIDGKLLSAYYNCNQKGVFTVDQTQIVKNGINESKHAMYSNSVAKVKDNRVDMNFTTLSSILELSINGVERMNINSIELSPVEKSKVEGALSGQFEVNMQTGDIRNITVLDDINVNFAGGADNTSGMIVKIPIGWVTIKEGLNVVVKYNDTEEYSDILWFNETFKTYNEVNSVKSAKYIKEDLNIVIGARDYFVKANGDPKSKGKSWDNATTLSSALKSAVDGSTIKLAAGIYSPADFISGSDETNNSHKTFEINKNISIEGGYPENPSSTSTPNVGNLTVLDGDNSVYHVVVITAPKSDEADVLLSNITIKGANNHSAASDGKVVINELNFSDCYGGGLFVSNSNVKLNNCIITQNASQKVAGCYVTHGGQLEINNSEIHNNIPVSMTGGVCAWNAHLKMKSTNIYDNVNTTTKISASSLYVYADKDCSSSAKIEDCTISGHNSTEAFGGVYVRGADATSDIIAEFSNCTIINNKAASGAGFSSTFADVTFDNCVIENNIATGNGGNIIYPGSKVNINNCVISRNEAGLAAGLYVYSNADKVELNVSNTEISENSCGSRGAGAYIRSDNYSSKVNFINTTFSKNVNKHYGSAIALYAKGNGKVDIDLISCTISENQSEGSSGGALGFETNGITANIYNTIISGNTHLTDNAKADIFINPAISPVLNIQNSILGSKTYNSKNEEIKDIPDFIAATMLSSFAKESGANSRTYKLIGDAVSNPAIGYGMSVSEISDKASSEFSSDIISKDQIGNNRESSIMGACVKK